MKRTDLVRELGLLESVVPKKSVIPIYSTALLRVQPEHKLLQLSALDGDIALTGVCADVDGSGDSVAVPARTLLEIVKSLNEETVQLTSNNGQLAVVSTGFRARLRLHDVADFPALPQPTEPEVNAKLPSDLLREMIRRVRAINTTADKRYFMEGALLELKDGCLRFVATDAHRLAIAEVPWASDAHEHTLLPRKFLDAITGLLEKNDADVQYMRTAQHLFVEIGARMIVSRQIEGQFPNYQRIIPPTPKLRAEIPRVAFLDALKRATKVSDEARRADIALEEGLLIVSAQSPDVGDVDERIPVEYAGERITFSMNNNYLQDFLSVSDTDTVSMLLTDERSQVLLHSTGGDIDYRYVVMPVVK
jgi:DNA polymerase-3 subunit beta